MFDSSWNSAQYKLFCGQISIVRNGETGPFILFDSHTGEPVSNVTYPTKEAAEEGRKVLYDSSFWG